MRKSMVMISVFMVLLCTIPTYGTELSADMLATDGLKKQLGKLYVKGSKYRIEMNGSSEYAIIRHDRNKSWIVLPEHKAYVEMLFDPKEQPAIEGKRAPETGRQFLGSEVIDGHATKKYHVTTEGEGIAANTFYQWVATDLDFPVKTVAVDGSWSMEYFNIKTSVPDSLFEIPEQYEKITMPSLIKERQGKPQ